MTKKIGKIIVAVVVISIVIIQFIQPKKKRAGNFRKPPFYAGKYRRSCKNNIEECVYGLPFEQYKL